MELYNDDCFKILPTINKNVNLFILDLPYGQTDNNWDVKIDLKKMWELIKRIQSVKCIIIFFCTTKFGYEIINSNSKGFRYDLVWDKPSHSVGFLNAKVMPLRSHEMVYIFQNLKAEVIPTEIKDYLNKLKEFINLSYSKIYKKCGKCITIFKTCSRSIGSEENYNLLIKHCNIDKCKDYIPFKKLKEIFDSYNCSNFTYNPQMTKGTPYSKRIKNESQCSNYNMKNKKFYHIENLGTRYPKSILKYGRDKKSYHTTQKPQELLEYLIKTYSNKGDIICDFTMGVGSTGVACKKLGRYFIGIEKEKKFFDIAKKRIEEINNES